MQKIINRALLLIIITLIGLLAYRTFKAPEPVKVEAITTIEQFPSEQEFKAKVATTVREYLSANPEVVIEAIEHFQKKKATEAQQKIDETIKEKKNELENAERNPFLGNVDASFPIVVFIDYNCSYCKKANAIIKELLQKNEHIKVIIRPLPILGDLSVKIAKIALAVHKIAPSKFSDFHNQLMELYPKTEIDELIKMSGILLQDIEAAAESQDITHILEENTKLAAALRIQGVPAFVVGNKLYPGALELTQIEEIISQISKNRK